MKIYLMRHATAEDPGSGPDAGRRLTESGRREAREAGRALRQRGVAPAAALTSPRLRARETANLVLSELGARVAVEVRDTLGGGTTQAVFLAELQSRESVGDVFLVGHNPDLSTFASLLAGDPISFLPSTVACFELQGDQARLEWVLHPHP
jgi:phosphohistidine phosphatase